MPKISVIIPIYGVEKYIERCAKSLFEQTLDDIEFIFVDDCTPDRSMEILASIIEDYQLRIEQMKYEVKSVRLSSNSGLATARRCGIQLSTSNFIIHCDSDDWIDVDMYKTMYQKALDTQSDVVVCDIMIHNGTLGSILVGCNSTIKKTFISDLMFQKNSWSLCNKLFKKSCYDGIVFPRENMGEDMVLTMQLLYNCDRISYIDSPFYYYFTNPSSIARTKTKESSISKFYQFNQNYQIIEDFFRTKKEYSTLTKELTWIKYAVKSLLVFPDKSCSRLWRSSYPKTEFKILLYKDVSLERKRIALKNIIKNYILYR